MQTFRNKRGQSDVILSAILLVIITVFSIALMGWLNQDKADTFTQQKKEVWKSSVISFTK